MYTFYFFNRQHKYRESELKLKLSSTAILMTNIFIHSFIINNHYD